MSQPEDQNELKAFEARLAALAPRADRLDRERLIFLAGQASVAASAEKSPALAGGWRRHPAWPAAFAAMTVVAATVFCLLVTQTTVTSSFVGRQNIADLNHHHVSPDLRLNASTLDSTNSLSARDALRSDFEDRIDKLSKADVAPMVSSDRMERPALTPASWRQINEDARSSTDDSSGLRILQRVNS
jgi:hypothetical protein